MYLFGRAHIVMNISKNVLIGGGGGIVIDCHHTLGSGLLMINSH